MTTGCVTTCGAPPENANPLAVNTALRAAAVAKIVVILPNIRPFDEPSFNVDVCDPQMRQQTDLIQAVASDGVVR
jgi:hypothetical protein